MVGKHGLEEVAVGPLAIVGSSEEGIVAIGIHAPDGGKVTIGLSFKDAEELLEVLPASIAKAKGKLNRKPSDN